MVLKTIPWPVYVSTEGTTFYTLSRRRCSALFQLVGIRVHRECQPYMFKECQPCLMASSTVLKLYECWKAVHAARSPTGISVHGTALKMC